MLNGRAGIDVSLAELAAIAGCSESLGAPWRISAAFSMGVNERRTAREIDRIIRPRMSRLSTDTYIDRGEANLLGYYSCYFRWLLRLLKSYETSVRNASAFQR